jgi:phosphoglycolate phosphatase
VTGPARTTIRAFRPSDREACQALAARAAMSSYAPVMPHLAGRLGPDTPLEPADQRLLAIVNGRVAGFVELVRAHVSNLFVDPPFQGGGVGAGLLAEVERRVEGDLTLSVFTVNPRARRLYERLGYGVESTALIPFAGQAAEVWRMRKRRACRNPAGRLVIFDFDGTLADSAGWMVGAVRRLADEAGFHSPSDAEIARLRGCSPRDVIRALGVPAFRLPTLAMRLRELSHDAAGEIPLFPGAGELLEALSDAGVRIALVSSNSEETVRAVLGPTRAGRVEHFACGASLLDKAREFRAVLQRSGVAPCQVLAVGDEGRDIEAARRAGVRAGAVSWGYAPPEALERLAPDYLFAGFEEIREALVAVRSGRPRPADAGATAAPP